MFDRLRNGALAGGGALVLILALSGMAMGASLTSDSGPAGDTSFVDIDGDGVADHCQAETATENTEATDCRTSSVPSVSQLSPACATSET